jgi:CBS domain-containing protein
MNEPDNSLERRLAGEHQTLARPLRALVRRAPVVCGEQSTVSEALTVMHAEGIGCMVIVDARTRPVGIFTERDLVGVALTVGVERPIAEVMTRDPLGLPGHTPAYEAALAMIDYRIRHVLVTEADKLVGVVSERDLFSLQRLGLGELTMEIRLARHVDSLAGLAARVRRLTRLMVEEGVEAEHLTLFVSILNDRISQRIIELMRNRYQWERIGWCWLAFGSEGRLEQTFATDQDNGLIFESHDDARPSDVRSKLLPFAREVNEALDACGYPLCKGNVMASNPELCLSVGEWQAKIKGWLHNSEPKALLDAAICFDLRAMHGDERLAVGLRDWLLGITRTSANFLRLMAENALDARPPLGRWRDFATEDAPNARNTINLKLHGVRPFVDTARIMALARGLPQTSTAERLRAASAAGAMPKAEADAAVASFFFVQAIRLRHQATLESLADDSANRIDPSALNELDRRTLKEAFRIARELQSRLALDYQL